MGTDKYGGSPGRDQPLSSPWDVAVGPPHEDILFVAMAGNHTIWGLFLETATWQKGRFVNIKILSMTCNGIVLSVLTFVWRENFGVCN